MKIDEVTGKQAHVADSPTDDAQKNTSGTSIPKNLKRYLPVYGALVVLIISFAVVPKAIATPPDRSAIQGAENNIAALQPGFEEEQAEVVAETTEWDGTIEAYYSDEDIPDINIIRKEQAIQCAIAYLNTVSDKFSWDDVRKDAVLHVDMSPMGDSAVWSVAFEITQDRQFWVAASHGVLDPELEEIFLDVSSDVLCVNINAYTGEFNCYSAVIGETWDEHLAAQQP